MTLFPALAQWTMRQTRDIALEELTAAGEPLSVAATRVDAAHSLGDAVARQPSLAEMPVEQAINELVGLDIPGEVKSQADQLAAHLNGRKQQLEQRAAELNAQEAVFQEELREARTWLAERVEQLNAREEQLAAREATTQASTAQPPVAPNNDSPQGSIGNLGSLDTDIPAPSGRSNRVDNPRIAPPRPHPAALVRERRKREAECAERREALKRAREQLDRRRTALEEFWNRSSRARREALELRFLAEELLAQLKAAVSTVKVEEALGIVRERLAERYRGAADQLGDPAYELDWLKSDLDREHERLERRYEDLKQRLQVTGDR